MKPTVCFPPLAVLSGIHHLWQAAGWIVTARITAGQLERGWHAREYGCRGNTLWLKFSLMRNNQQEPRGEGAGVALMKVHWRLNWPRNWWKQFEQIHPELHVRMFVAVYWLPIKNFDFIYLLIILYYYFVFIYLTDNELNVFWVAIKFDQLVVVWY